MAEIKLANGFNVLVDDEDVERIFDRKWRGTTIGKKGRATYATYTFNERVNGKRKRRIVYMHREIMRAPHGMDVDHINKNTLDNRKENLRICTRSQNLAGMRRTNATGYRGVAQSAPNTFMARCGRDSEIKYFRTAEEAAREYDRMAVEKFGEFATLNFPIGAPTHGVCENEKD